MGDKAAVEGVVRGKPGTPFRGDGARCSWGQRARRRKAAQACPLRQRVPPSTCNRRHQHQQAAAGPAGPAQCQGRPHRARGVGQPAPHLADEGRHVHGEREGKLVGHLDAVHALRWGWGWGWGGGGHVGEKRHLEMWAAPRGARLTAGAIRSTRETPRAMLSTAQRTPFQAAPSRVLGSSPGSRTQSAAARSRARGAAGAAPAAAWR